MVPCPSWHYAIWCPVPAGTLFEGLPLGVSASLGDSTLVYGKVRAGYAWNRKCFLWCSFDTIVKAQFIAMDTDPRPKIR